MINNHTSKCSIIMKESDLYVYSCTSIISMCNTNFHEGLLKKTKLNIFVKHTKYIAYSYEIVLNTHMYRALAALHIHTTTHT